MWLLLLLAGALALSRRANGNGGGELAIAREEADFFFEDSMFENAGVNQWFLKTKVKNRKIKRPVVINIAGELKAFKVTVIINGVPVEEFKGEDAIGQDNIYGGAIPSGTPLKVEVRHFKENGDEVIDDFINLQAQIG